MSNDAGRAGHLRRSVGFYGLMFVSLGSIIGSGWLLGAVKAAQSAGPASVLSWLLAAAMLALLALTYAELGVAYPVAGGTARYSYYCHGPFAGFTAGWASWLQAVFIPSIEVLAMITYVNSVDAVHAHFTMLTHDPVTNTDFLNGTGLAVALGLMILFTAINLAGGKALSDSNSVVVIWKTAVPVLAIVVIAATQFEPANFHSGGGFMPYGMHGVFAALSGGVVFGLQGFEQAVQLAGEAKNPARDLSRAVLGAMLVGALIYSLLQVVMIGALSPADVHAGWDAPLGAAKEAYSPDRAGGAWYALAMALGLGWLAKVLLVDAIISPGGTGIVYVGSSARLSYALGEQRELPRALASTNKKGTPVVSILVAAVVGCVAFGPFKSWKDLVDVVTLATAIMYGFGPIALAALHRLDPDRPRSYRVPRPKLLLPAAFASANLIMYWSGFDKTWKLMIAIAAGQLVFAIGAWRARTASARTFRTSAWIVPWLAGHVLIGYLGRYDGGHEILPAWIDVLVVIAFSLVIFYYALATTSSPEEAADAIAKDAHQLDPHAAP